MKVATFLTTLGLLATSSLLTTHAATENRQTDSLTIKADSLNTDSTTSAFLSQKKIIISKWQRQSKLHLTSFIALAVEGSLRGMMAQWLPDDKTKIVALYNKVCGAQLSATAMKAIIAKDVNAMLRELNAQRKAFATEHPQLAVQTSESKLSARRFSKDASLTARSGLDGFGADCRAGSTERMRSTTIKRHRPDKNRSACFTRP